MPRETRWRHADRRTCVLSVPYLVLGTTLIVPSRVLSGAMFARSCIDLFFSIPLWIISQTLSIVAVIGQAPSAFESTCTTGIGAMRSDGHAEDSLAVGSTSVLGCPAHMGAEPLR